MVLGEGLIALRFIEKNSKKPSLCSGYFKTLSMNFGAINPKSPSKTCYYFIFTHLYSNILVLVRVKIRLQVNGKWISWNTKFRVGYREVDLSRLWILLE